MNNWATEMQQEFRINDRWAKEMNRFATIAGWLLLFFTIAGLVLGFGLGYEFATMSGPARFSFHAAAQHLRSAWECAIYALQVW